MSPRRTRAHIEMSMVAGVHEGVLDASPAEIAAGVWLPITSRRANVTVGDYLVSVIVTIRARRAECDLIEVKGRHGQQITATSLRELPVAAIVESVMLGLFGSPFQMNGKKRVPIATQAAVEAREGRIPRRQLMPLVIEAYRAAVSRQDHSPVLTVATKLNYSPKYISKLLSEARRDKLMGPAHPGVAGELELDKP